MGKPSIKIQKIYCFFEVKTLMTDFIVFMGLSAKFIFIPSPNFEGTKIIFSLNISPHFVKTVISMGDLGLKKISMEPSF